MAVSKRHVSASAVWVARVAERMQSRRRVNPAAFGARYADVLNVVAQAYTHLLGGGFGIRKLESLRANHVDWLISAWGVEAHPGRDGLMRLKTLALWCERGIDKPGLVESRLTPPLVMLLKGRVSTSKGRKARGPSVPVDDAQWLAALAARPDLVPWHVAKLREIGLRVDEALQVTERALIASSKVTPAAVARLVAMTKAGPTTTEGPSTQPDRWHLVLTGPKGRHTRTLEVAHDAVAVLREAFAFAASKGRRQLLWPECELERGVRKVTNVFASERRALRARGEASPDPGGAEPREAA